MHNRRVAVDASTLIGLAIVRRFELLQRIFGKVDVTDAVRAEVCAGRNLPGAGELESAVANGWITIVAADVNPIFTGLGAGEASTLTYANTVGALVVTDDLAARLHAVASGLEVTGIGGVLIQAKRRGFVTEIRPVIERLRAGGFRLSDEVVHQLLVAAGEETG